MEHRQLPRILANCICPPCIEQTLVCMKRHGESVAVNTLAAVKRTGASVRAGPLFQLRNIMHMAVRYTAKLDTCLTRSQQSGLHLLLSYSSIPLLVCVGDKSCKLSINHLKGRHELQLPVSLSHTNHGGHWKTEDSFFNLFTCESSSKTIEQLKIRDCTDDIRIEVIAISTTFTVCRHWLGSVYIESERTE